MAFVNRICLARAARSSVARMFYTQNGLSSTKSLMKVPKKVQPLGGAKNINSGNIDLIGVARTIQLLVNFEWPKPISDRAVHSVCCALIDASDPMTKQPRKSQRPVRQIFSRGHVYLDKRIWKWHGSGLTSEELLGFILMMKRGGHLPTREVYTEVLKIAMCVGNTSSGGTQYSAATQELLKLMCEDHGKEAGLEGMYSGALFVASNEPQIDVLWKKLNENGMDFTKEGSQQLLESYITAICQGTAKNAVNSFMLKVVPKLPSSSVHLFEKLLDKCYWSRQLSRGINTYTCMTRTYRIAPSEKAYTLFTSLLTHFSENNKVVNLPFCSRILRETEELFFNRPPLWVYSKMAMLFVGLAGVDGYNHLMSLTKQRAIQAIQKTATPNPVVSPINPASRALIKQFWGAHLFSRLLRHAVNARNANLAFHLFEEMKSLGIPSRRGNYVLLLRVVDSPEDLDKYLSILLKESELIEPGDWLLSHLHEALNKIFNGKGDNQLVQSRRDTVNDGRAKELLLLSAHQQIELALLGTSHQYCLDHIASLGRRVRVGGLENSQQGDYGRVSKEEVAM